MIFIKINQNRKPENEKKSSTSVRIELDQMDLLTPYFKFLLYTNLNPKKKVKKIKKMPQLK